MSMTSAIALISISFVMILLVLFTDAPDADDKMRRITEDQCELLTKSKRLQHDVLEGILTKSSVKWEKPNCYKGSCPDNWKDNLRGQYYTTWSLKNGTSVAIEMIDLHHVFRDEAPQLVVGNSYIMCVKPYKAAGGAVRRMAVVPTIKKLPSSN